MPPTTSTPPVRPPLPTAADLPASASATPVVGQVFAIAERTPDAVALTAFAGAVGETRRTYAELRRDVTRLADGLRRAGVRPGERLGILVDSRHAAQAMTAIFASNLLGAVVVPLNARYAARELRDALRRSGCATLIAAPDQLETLARIRADLPDLLRVIPAEAGAAGAPGYAEILDAGDAEAGGWPRLDPDAMSEIMFTSGTTAAPKAAVTTHGRTAASAHIYRALLELTREDVLHSFFPIFTTASTRCVALPALTAGARAVLDPAMDVPEVVARMGRERSTLYYAVPAFYIFLLEAAQQAEAAGRPLSLPDLRLLIYGGAAMPEATIAELRRRFPGLAAMQTLGSTETGATGAALQPEFAAAKLGSVGKAYPFTDVRLVDDAGREVATGEVGEFAVRSGGCFREYLDDPENTAATIRDGWVLMGDLGKRDADGFLFHVDRKKDIIIRGGHNIGSMEVESALYEHPGVAEAAAVAVPHPRLGEDVFVFVVRSPGSQVNAETLTAHCRARLADYKAPRRIAFIAQMPRNPMGKIVKTELREQARRIAEAPA
ncbi:MAG: class I adenylate-forming enzyme family protein [Albimonas sp.]|uniref:class I adenylate-forming enzyme family protein n=1 Tax=Albimonas sp. TaxID=1872425 RepID=UPI004056FA2D